MLDLKDDILVKLEEQKKDEVSGAIGPEIKK